MHKNENFQLPRLFSYIVHSINFYLYKFIIYEIMLSLLFQYFKTVQLTMSLVVISHYSNENSYENVIC